MPAAQIFLQGRRLAPAFDFGCLRFEGADAVEVEDGFWSVEDAEASLRLSASYPPDSPWRGYALVVFFMYQLPAGAEEFRETVERFRKDAKAKVRVPGVGKFEKDVLQPLDLPDGWTHERFARSGRDLFHVYQSDSLGVMIRWSAQGGDVSDHPLLSGLAPTVRLAPDQWATAPPEHREDPDAEGFDAEGFEGDEDEPEGEPVTHIDLRDEAEAFRAFLQQRVAEFDSAHNYGPGENGPITRATVGFDADQGGWIAVVFDTRPDAQSDGKWTLYLDGGTLLDRPDWPALTEHLCDGGEVTVIGLDGRESTETDADALTVRLGETLTAVVNDERTGLPERVPAAEAAWSVEDFNGNY